MTDRPEIVTPEWVRRKVREIDEQARWQSPSREWDDERAHRMEGELHRAVLHAIAFGECSDRRECAEAALETLSLDFDRWYA